jgi:hypothetical protein
LTTAHVHNFLTFEVVGNEPRVAFGSIYSNAVPQDETPSKADPNPNELG